MEIKGKVYCLFEQSGTFKKEMDKIDTLIDIGNAILRALNEMKERDEIPMTRQQAAVYLGVSLTTIDNYRKQGRIRQIVKDGIVGYLPSELKKNKK